MRPPCGFQSPVSLERVRNTPNWQDSLGHGSFNIKVLPTGRIRFEKLDQEIQQARAMRPALDDLTFARIAIDEARKSVSEKDDRVHPKVGAVVVKDGQAQRIVASSPAITLNSPQWRGSCPSSCRSHGLFNSRTCTTRSHPKIPCGLRSCSAKLKAYVPL